MKQHNEDIKTHTELQSTKLCTVWRITRRDGVVIGITDHDVEFTIAGTLYKNDLASSASQVDKGTGGDADAQDIIGSFLEGTISWNDLVAGQYDYARVDIARVRWDAIPTSFTEKKVIWLMTGYFGEVRHGPEMFGVELRSLGQMLQMKSGRATTALCDNDLFDSACKVVKATYLVSNSVGSVPNSRQIGCTLTEGAGYFAEGTLVFTSGPASGNVHEIKWYSPGSIQLFEPMEVLPDAADTFDITPGCDKTTTICSGRYNNILNFRGFPHIPGKDKWTAGYQA